MAQHCCCEFLAFGNLSRICGFAEVSSHQAFPTFSGSQGSIPKMTSLLRWMPCFIVLPQTSCSTTRCVVRFFGCIKWPQDVTFQYYDPSAGARSSNIEELIIVCSDFGHHCTFTNPLPLQCLVQWIDAWYCTCGLLS